jgi:hypothetical protein
MITVDASSAVIGGTFNLATPAVATDGGTTGDFVVAHLTHGLNKRDPDKNASALRIDGQVRITEAGAKPPGFEVAFLQFVRFNFIGQFYAGRKRTEGSVGIVAHPALPQLVLVDALEEIPPFISEASFTSAGGLAKNSMGDHPFLSCARAVWNFKQGVPNYLFHIVDDRDFWTVFSVRDAGKFQHLMHLHWRVRHDVKVQWRNGIPVQAIKASSFTVDAQPTKGAPTEAFLKALLASPSPPFARSEFKAALQRAAQQPNPHRSDNPEWFANVAADFFR